MKLRVSHCFCLGTVFVVVVFVRCDYHLGGLLFLLRNTHVRIKMCHRHLLLRRRKQAVYCDLVVQFGKELIEQE